MDLILLFEQNVYTHVDEGEIEIGEQTPTKMCYIDFQGEILALRCGID